MTAAGGSFETPVAGLAEGATYAVRFPDDATSLDALLQVKTATGSASVSFALTGADPRSTYTARVCAFNPGGGGASVPSVAQSALKVKWCNSVGHALIKSVEWDIGGSRVDLHTGEHYDLLCELTEAEEKRRGYSAMIGRYDAYDIDYDSTSCGGACTLLVPLRFSFNSVPGGALPLVALQFHDLKLNFEFRGFLELVKTNLPLTSLRSEPSVTACKLYANYVFLGQEERARFAQIPHEYLIEQLQSQVENVAASTNPDSVVNRKITLALNHPVKEIVFVFQPASATAKDPVGGNDWFSYDIPGRESEEIFEDATIQFNGQDRFGRQPAKYFRLMQPYRHHTRCPTKRVHAYSFALHPETLPSPSGAANFSRIDSAHLSLRLNPNIPAGVLRIHAYSYNVLRIAQGMGGLVFTS
jgi:hypothetical protein